MAPKGAAPPAVRQSRSCGRNLERNHLLTLPAERGVLRTLAFGNMQ